MTRSATGMDERRWACVYRRAPRSRVLVPGFPGLLAVVDFGCRKPGLPYRPQVGCGPGPGGGPDNGGPTQTSSRPQERSTRAATPCRSVSPDGVVVRDTSPAWTVSVRRLCEVVVWRSIAHGNPGSDVAEKTWTLPAAICPTLEPFTRTVTAIEVSLSMWRSRSPEPWLAHAPATPASEARRMRRLRVRNRTKTDVLVLFLGWSHQEDDGLAFTAKSP
jgi:hypothetical protein